MHNLLSSKGINVRVSMLYTPQQNGCAEREVRTFVECSKPIIYTRDMPIKLWAEFVSIANYALNSTSASSIKGKSPAELWLNKEINRNPELECSGAVFSLEPEPEL